MLKNLQVFIFLLLTYHTKAQFDTLSPTSEGQTGLNTFYTKAEPTDMANFFGIIWVLGQFLCLILMLVDVYFRYKGKPKRWMGVYRFVIFAFGACTPNLIGIMYEGAYRGFLGTMLKGFYESVYLGGFESAPSISLLPDVTNSGGAVFKKYFNYVNVNLIQLVLLIILGILCIVKRKDYLQKGNVSNLIYMLFYIVAYFSVFPLVHWGLFFLKQAAKIYEWNEKFGTDFNRNTVHYIFAYFVMILAFIGVSLLWLRLFYTSKVAGGPLLRQILRDTLEGFRRNSKKKKKKDGYKQTGRDANDPRNLGQSQYIRNPQPPANGNKNQDQETSKQNLFNNYFSE